MNSASSLSCAIELDKSCQTSSSLKSSVTQCCISSRSSARRPSRTLIIMGIVRMIRNLRTLRLKANQLRCTRLTPLYRLQLITLQARQVLTAMSPSRSQQVDLPLASSPRALSRSSKTSTQSVLQTMSCPNWKLSSRTATTTVDVVAVRL